jgi:hypothetical protein
VAVTGHDRDDHYDEQTASSTPWHNRTPAVVGASVVGVAVLGILFLAVSYVVRQSGETEQAPAYFVEPTFSATAPSTSPTTTATTTQTITSTVPPVTSDINPSSGPPTSSSETSGSETSSPETTAEEDEDDEESRLPTTRRTPRTNITRTLYPRP